MLSDDTSTTAKAKAPPPKSQPLNEGKDKKAAEADEVEEFNSKVDRVTLPTKIEGNRIRQGDIMLRCNVCPPI
jgi:hypothetical protein